MRNLILSGLCIGLLLVSCDQVAEKVKNEAQGLASETNAQVQKAINDLNLEYVEEGAQTVLQMWQGIYSAQSSLTLGI